MKEEVSRVKAVTWEVRRSGGIVRSSRSGALVDYCTVMTDRSPYFNGIF